MCTYLTFFLCGVHPYRGRACFSALRLSISISDLDGGVLSAFLHKDIARAVEVHHALFTHPLAPYADILSP